MLRLILASLLAAIAVPTLASDVQPLTIGNETIAPGTRADFRLNVPAFGEEPGTFIPVTVIHGKETGPVLAAVAGVHGYEFPPILAADRLADRIDPADLTGTVILVRIANIPSYEGKSPHLNPVDGKNLNRSFPGSRSGTSTERIADILSREVVARADFLLDLHCGDGAEYLEPFVGVYGGPLATNFQLALEVGKGFGFPNVVRYSMNTQAQVDTGRSLNRQGVASGIPTVLVEYGQNGRRDEEFVAGIVTGVENALSILGIWDEPRQNVPPVLRRFESTTAARASHSGLFYPAEPERRYWFKGDLIGTIRDYSGEEVEQIYSPIDGYALYGITGPPVREGWSVATIGNPIDGF
ncbi:M14 family metallopeptidase [Erythrobacter sp. W53]|uniref:M14 family metallopeptidase n=1 Tax=Erythrobacter sp. W53 TaxID=3425947 RepID=UPI003D767AFB